MVGKDGVARESAAKAADCPALAMVHWVANGGAAARRTWLSGGGSSCLKQLLTIH